MKTKLHTYYILLPGDTEENISDANILGEESTHNNFWPGDGLVALNNILNQRPDMLEHITIIRSDRKVITVEKFLNDIKKFKFVKK
jgi:hypothetical protein